MEPETMRRRVAVRWSSVSGDGDGDAAEAVAEIEAWLAQQPAESDWNGVLGQLRDTLLRASVAPILTEDPEARALLFALAAAEDAADLDATLTALARRTDALVEARERTTLGPARSVDRILGEAQRGGPVRNLFRI